VTTPRHERKPFDQCKLVAFCREYHGGMDSALYMIGLEGRIRSHRHARMAYREMAQDLLDFRAMVHRLEKGTAQYHEARRSVEDIEDAIDFIRLKYPGVS
jgi:hypothetical protein